jgi:hypothetical protein
MAGKRASLFVRSCLPRKGGSKAMKNLDYDILYWTLSVITAVFIVGCLNHFASRLW